jgi:hypothetical protein
MITITAMSIPIMLASSNLQSEQFMICLPSGKIFFRMSFTVRIEAWHVFAIHFAQQQFHQAQLLDCLLH